MVGPKVHNQRFRGDAPDANLIVITARGDAQTIWMEGDGVDICVVAAES